MLNNSISRESDGYMKSFNVNQKDEYMEFLAKYNFVILQILSEEEANQTVSDFFENVAVNVDIYNSDTWENEYWPENSRYLVGYALTEKAFQNRTHKNLHQAFTNILGTDNLVTMIDRWGIMRPSRNRPDWKWQLEPHVDVNPWRYVKELKEGQPRVYQGVLSLVDSYDSWCTTGGFSIVPGSANMLEEWTKRFPDPTNGLAVSYHHRKDDPFYNKLERIPLRKGEICIWDSGCVHANFQNTSENDFRIVQYISMAPANGLRSRMFNHYPSIYFKNNKIDLSGFNLNQRQLNLLK